MINTPQQDLLSRVMLAPLVARRWEAIAPVIAQAIIDSGADRDAVPDEQARLAAGGCLEIYVTMPNGKEVYLLVEPDQWEWAE